MDRTQIVWELVSEKSGSKVSMTQVGLAPGIECFEDCHEGWNFFIGKSLLQFLNTGKGLPDREGSA